MPIYEYQCQHCGRVQEVMQKMSDPGPAECSACQGGPLVKVLSKTAFILKGNGWYVTDFRDKGKKASDPAKSDGDAASSATAATKDAAATATKDATPAASATTSDTPAASSVTPAVKPASPASSGS